MDEKKSPGAYQSWESMYERQRAEIPRNAPERTILELFGEGESIPGVTARLTEVYGISGVEGLRMIEDIQRRCNEWEVEHWVSGTLGSN